MDKRNWAPIEQHLGEDGLLHDPEVFAPVHWKQLAAGIAKSAGLIPEHERLVACAFLLWTLQGDSDEFDDGDVDEFIRAADCDPLTPLWAEDNDAVALLERLKEEYR